MEEFVVDKIVELGKKIHDEKLKENPNKGDLQK